MVTRLRGFIDQVSRRLGGPRVVALPLLRTLAFLALLAWDALSPTAAPGWDTVDAIILAFLFYSIALEGALWYRASWALRLSPLVLLADLAFALVIIHLTGGAHSALYLALPLIAALQSYYYGIRRGVAVAVVSTAGYLVVVWPTLAGVAVGNVAIRVVVLLGTAIAVGILAGFEEHERRRVVTLSAEAQAREAFIRGVVGNLSEGVFALDGEGRIMTWNRALQSRYGVEESEVLGRHYLECFPRAREEAMGGPLARLLRGEIENFTLGAVEHETPRKERVVVNLKGSLLREDTRPAGAVVLVEDITERVALERSARQGEKLAALGTLATGLAHELNNPIGIISTRAELMLLDAESDGLPTGLRDDLNVIHRNAQRVARITQGLLSFARQSSGEFGHVDLNQLVDETLLLVEKQIVRDGIALKRSLAPYLPPIRGDGNALQQVLMNLLTNARDAVEAGGEIVIETMATREPTPSVRLAVHDTGPGIPPELLAKIFDPFFTTKPSGTGLGLSISYGIVREHEGTVDVHSKPGEGTKFILTFPGVKDAGAA